jgi:capsule polysaccharide export protein KpsE/RkpR
MKKIREGLVATAMKVKKEALIREVQRQGVRLDETGKFCSLEKDGFAPDELQEIASKVVAERDAYVAEGTTSGAVSNAYRSGWDAVFGKRRAKA